MCKLYLGLAQGCQRGSSHDAWLPSQSLSYISRPCCCYSSLSLPANLRISNIKLHAALRPGHKILLLAHATP